MSNKKQNSLGVPFAEKLRILCEQAMANSRNLQQFRQDSSNHKLPPLPSSRQPYIQNLTRSALGNPCFSGNNLTNSPSNPQREDQRDSKLNVTKIVFDRKSLQRVRGRALHEGASFANRLNHPPILTGRVKSRNDLHTDNITIRSQNSQQSLSETLTEPLRATRSKAYPMYPSIFTRHQPKGTEKIEAEPSQLSTHFGDPARDMLRSLRDTIYGKETFSARRGQTLDLRTISIYNQHLVVKRRKNPERKEFGSLEPWQKQPDEETLFQY